MEQDELREILDEFFIEATDSLDQLEADLIHLENMAAEGTAGGEVVDRLFRVLHTLKGGAGFLGLEKMAKVAHAGENLLDDVRGGKIPVTTPVMNVLLETNDALKELLQKHKDEEDVATLDYSALIAKLADLVANGGQMAAPTESAPTDSAPAELAAQSIHVNQDLLAEVLADESLNPDKDPEAKVQSAQSGQPGQPGIAFAPDSTSSGTPSVHVNQDLLAEVLADESLNPDKDPEAKAQPAQPPAAPAAPVSAAPAPVAAPAPAPEIKKGAKPEERRTNTEGRRDEDDRRQQPAGRRASDAGHETIRVEVERLDKVMNLVGELVLARNALLRQLSTPEALEQMGDSELITKIQANIEQFSHVTQDLQMSVLSTRMQPIKRVFDKIPRQVRELKSQLGKEVNLMIEGEMTEVDKSLVEDLGDPMVHMVRNALDHGIETPAERIAAGKDAVGTLAVRAFYEGNNVVVQIAEDGKGIDPVKIRQVAVKKGIITEDAANALSDQDAIRLIMAPGFSTAESISSVSGRGVGMDVVNDKISGLKGTLDIQSEVGKGTTFSIYLPLTLAIVQALVVKSNDEGFAIPISDISEVIKFKPEHIHKMSDQDVIELRGDSLPLFYLSKLTKRGYLPPQVQPVLPVRQMPARAGANESGSGGGLSIDDLDAMTGALPGTAGFGNGTGTSVNTNTGNNTAQGHRKGVAGYIVVVRDGPHALGLVVNDLIGQEEAVIKPVMELFKHHPAISGATITGEGTVHMILDVPYMLKSIAKNR